VGGKVEKENEMKEKQEAEAQMGGESVCVRVHVKRRESETTRATLRNK